MSDREREALRRAVEVLSKAGPRMPETEAETDELEAQHEELARTFDTGGTDTPRAQT